MKIAFCFRSLAQRRPLTVFVFVHSSTSMTCVRRVIDLASNHRADSAPPTPTLGF